MNENLSKMCKICRRHLISFGLKPFRQFIEKLRLPIKIPQYFSLLTLTAHAMHFDE